jgi:predicted nucleic acid-binding protein
VTTWCDARLPADLYVTSITAAEIHFGIACMTEGRRRADLQERFNGFLDLGFAGRVLDFTAESAKSYGPLMAARRAAGRPSETHPRGEKTTRPNQQLLDNNAWR